MGNLKRYIIALITLLIIIIIVIAIISYFGKENEVRIGEIEGDIETELVRLNNYNTYYSIEKMMNNYYLYLRVQNKKAVYSLLNKEYTEQNSIDETNVIDKLYIEEHIEDGINVKEIYVKQDLQYPTYLIKTNIKQDINKKSYYIFYEDNEQGAFAIRPIVEEEYNLYVQGVINLEINEDEIQRNNYNKVLRRTLEDEEKVEKYFEDYLQNALYNVEEAYNSLDEEFRDKKFGSIEKYKQYLNNKHDQLTSMDYNSIKEQQDFQTEEDYIEYISNLTTAGLDKYQINEYGDCTQYICIDDYGNNYIFNSTSVFQYTVILDTYTVDLQKFIEKYIVATDKDKVLLNIQKLITATKDGDYRYVYSKLDNSFKLANFSTQEKFERYIKEKYSEKDTIEFTKYEKINNAHIYDIEITKNNGNKVKAQIVMQLNEGTDFVMSFSAVE